MPTGDTAVFHAGLLPTAGVLGTPAIIQQQQQPQVIATGASLPGLSATSDAASRVPVTRVAPAASPAGLAAGCLASIAPYQQCGGNWSSVAHTCSEFDSCENTAWTGACCPADAACGKLTVGMCWSCGGGFAPWLGATPALPLCMGSPADGADYNYGCVLNASMLFYETQRAGKLPASNRISWRGDSSLKDKAPNNASLAGGWWVAADVGWQGWAGEAATR